MAISDQTIERVKDAVDIVDVVGDFVSLKRSGQGYKALSPFTNEKTPSFYVTPSKGIYKCFSSGKGGDAINFVMELEGLDYVETIRFLAQKYGIEIEEDTRPEVVEQNTLRESLQIVMRYANQHFQDSLWETEQGRNIGLSYFRERGYNEATIRKFELGYALDEWEGLLTKAKKDGHSEEMLEKAGLILKREGKDSYYDRFRGRVTFPIHSVAGKVIAFGARILKKDKKQPKYINSPETEIYHKSNVLYGIHLAKQPIRQQENCYLVEGYTDVISLHLAGIENVVSSSGTSLTENQIAILKRYTSLVTVLYDGDAAGIRASLRGIDLLLEKGLQVKIVRLPEDEDPDSFSRSQGSTSFQEYLQDHAQDFIAFKSEVILDEAGKDPVKRSQAIREIIQSLSKIPDAIQRMMYVKETAVKFELSEEVLIGELNKFLIRKKQESNKKRKEESEETVNLEFATGEDRREINTLDVLYLQEKECIRLLLNFGDNEVEESYHLYDYLREELRDMEIHHPLYRKVFDLFYQQVQQGNVPGISYFLDEVDDDEVKQLVVELSTDLHDLSENWSTKWQIEVPRQINPVKNVLRIKFRNIRRLIEYNQEDMKAAEELSKSEQVDELIRMHMELKKYEIELAQALGNVVAK